MEPDPCVLVLLANMPADFSTPYEFSNPEMICTFEMTLRMFMWHPKVSVWFRDTLGYAAKLDLKQKPFEWGLTARFQEPEDLVLFKIAFAQPLQGFV